MAGQHRTGMGVGLVACGLLALTVGGTGLRPAQAAPFKLTVEGLEKGKRVPETNVFDGFGCSGENKSPALSWTGAPRDTKAFAVTIYDPDAPTGSGWWHWVVYNLPAGATALPQGAGNAKGDLPGDAKQGRNDYGQKTYGGPCPPPGKPHRYVFKVYALKEAIEVPDDASPALIGFNLNAAKLAEASVTATYKR